MSDEISVTDRRRVKQDDLGPAAVVRTTTLATKEPTKSSKEQTEAQLAVKKAKAIDAGRPESAIAEPPKKSRPSTPPWNKDNKALQDRRVDAPDSRVHAPVGETKNPLEEATLASPEDGLAWCGCGRALYVTAGGVVLCRDGHRDGVSEGKGPLSWEDAARHLRDECQTAIHAAVAMATKSSDVSAFWREEDEKLIAENRRAEAEAAVEAVETTAEIEKPLQCSVARFVPGMVEPEVDVTSLDAIRARLDALEARLLGGPAPKSEPEAIATDLGAVRGRVERLMRQERQLDQRALALVLTKIDEAMLWLTAAVR